MLLYLGNNLRSVRVTQTTMSILSNLLRTEGFQVKMASSHRIQFFRLLSMVLHVFKYSKKAKYVLIDTYSTRNFYYAVLISQLCRLLKIKYIPILHGGNLPNRLDRSPRISRLLFKHSYKNIAPSNYLKLEFQVRGYESVFIPNVLEIKDYKYQERKLDFPKLLYVRAFSKIYNPEMAIKVLWELKKEHPEAKLCMIGPEKDESINSCKELTKSLGLENNVEFTGKLSKPEWHKKAEEYNIFINTTNIDNTPVSVMEAMALGLPIISTNVGGIPYLIENNINGLLVEKDDVDNMVKSIIKICQDQELAKKLTINARRSVEQFDWEKIKFLWLKILQ